MISWPLDSEDQRPTCIGEKNELITLAPHPLITFYSKSNKEYTPLDITTRTVRVSCQNLCQSCYVSLLFVCRVEMYLPYYRISLESKISQSCSEFQSSKIISSYLLILRTKASRLHYYSTYGLQSTSRFLLYSPHSISVRPRE